MSGPKFKTVAEYLDSFPKDTQSTLQTLRATIKDQLPKDSEEVISYNIPCFKINGKYLVYFAAFKDHISLYPFTRELESHFKDQIKDFKTSGKGTIQFPLDKPLPLPLIKQIIAFMLKSRV